LASEAAEAGYNEPRSDALKTAPAWVAGAEAVALIELTKS
jgi:hypothetical protein